MTVRILLSPVFTSVKTSNLTSRNYGKVTLQWIHLPDHALQPWRWRQHGLRNVGFNHRTTRCNNPESNDFCLVSSSSHRSDEAKEQMFTLPC